jgi:surfeit locus 1 family protein
MLLRPRWLLSHLLVLVLVVVMVGAGLWQLARLDEREDRNAEVRARRELPAQPLEDLVAAAGDDLGALQYRIGTATGEFDPAGELLVANRTFDGAPGFWVLTPLVTGPGRVVVVNRGFVPRPVALGEDPSAYAAPSGVVTVAGTVQPSRGGGVVVESGGLRQISRPDVRALTEGTERSPAPVLLQLDEAQPPLRPVPPPDLGDGPHLSYAFQWFVFALIAVVGYPLVLRRVLRGEAGRGDVAVDADVGTARQ